MVALKFKVIKSKTQYVAYSKALEKLTSMNGRSQEINDEIDLLTLLIEKWDDEHRKHEDVDPIALLLSLMEQKQLKAKDLAGILGVSKGLVSDILNYKKGLSKESIRILSDYFKVSQDAFNRPVKLRNSFR